MIGSPLPYVGPDNCKGAREAVEHLLRLGRRRIGFLGGDATMTTQQERVSGWRDALNAAGLAARQFAHHRIGADARRRKDRDRTRLVAPAAPDRGPLL